MDRFSLICLFLFSAAVMAGSFQVAPQALAMEELLVNLSTDIDSAQKKPKRLQAAPEKRVKILKRRKALNPMRKKRFPELSSRHIVIIARNKKGEEINQSVLLDPRLIRAEIFAPEGHPQSGQDLLRSCPAKAPIHETFAPESGRIVHSDQFYRDDVDFIVDLPDDAGIDKIQFYHPRWTGSAFELELIGETQLQ